MDDSAIECDEIIESYNEETKTIPAKFNKNKTTCKTQNFFILFAFLLITIALLIAVSNLLLFNKKTFITISRQKQQIKRSFILINLLQKWKVMIN